jgi:hypothetical protein
VEWWSRSHGSGTVEGRNGRSELGGVHWNSGSKAIGTSELRCDSGVRSRVRVESVGHLQLNMPQHGPRGRVVVGWIIIDAFTGIPTGLGNWPFWVSGSPAGIKLNPCMNPVLFGSGSGQIHACKIALKPAPVRLKTRRLPETRTRIAIRKCGVKKLLSVAKGSAEPKILGRGT